ncbi:DUF3192 domain-containing protein [Pseudidiomarina terrestris]|uniref:DUF3192 domain-containing protein n=1 Tax=Pseudidiomarina terrestris TaxID=2820060 RepID=A0AAW7R0F8_9GAMM|nr:MULTISPECIES: DUF3192 domain-containing protein [unclassified Pseudidiomarina]MDN7125217.1 DUF3192 domain-containing protein [Pseudidiomarina sp. 1APP75-32.1]MDN7127382.1 DUF3192 domain-containing protein [Pseudidiomarina sp. 1APR75-33.1]MDN7136128.1 DUF3192 domain-containing protein [Pseudidiomarina sp. 1ASP75-5]
MKAIKGLAAAVAILAASATLQGCIIVADGEHGDGYSSSDFRKQEEQNRQMISALSDSATLTDVRSRMGTPDFANRTTVDGARYDVLYYRTHRVEADGNTSKDECTPLVFKDSILVGTGELALSRIPQSY